MKKIIFTVTALLTLTGCFGNDVENTYTVVRKDGDTLYLKAYDFYVDNVADYVLFFSEGGDQLVTDVVVILTEDQQRNKITYK